MESIIEELIKIEDAAQNIIMDTEQEKKKLASEIKNMREDIFNKMIGKTKEQVDKMIQESALESEKRVTEIKESGYKKREAMQKEYDETSNSWAFDIYKKIIGR